MNKVPPLLNQPQYANGWLDQIRDEYLKKYPNDNGVLFEPFKEGYVSCYAIVEARIEQLEKWMYEAREDARKLRVKQ